MLLADRVAVVHGATGAVGSAVAGAFAAAGAHTIVGGRDIDAAQRVADRIAALGGSAEAAHVNALDEVEVDHHVGDVVAKHGRVDIAFNAMGFSPVQGVPLTELGVSDFVAPFNIWVKAQFITARAAARHMTAAGSGVIILLSASPARLAMALTTGFGVACAAIEGLTRTLAAELGPHGVRAVCIRSHRIDETLTDADFPMPIDEFREFVAGATLLRRLPTLREVTDTAVFLASDGAGAITGAGDLVVVAM